MNFTRHQIRQIPFRGLLLADALCELGEIMELAMYFYLNGVGKFDCVLPSDC